MTRLVARKTSRCEPSEALRAQLLDLRPIDDPVPVQVGPLQSGATPRGGGKRRQCAQHSGDGGGSGGECEFAHGLPPMGKAGKSRPHPLYAPGAETLRSVIRGISPGQWKRTGTPDAPAPRLV